MRHSCCHQNCCCDCNCNRRFPSYQYWPRDPVLSAALKVVEYFNSEKETPSKTKVVVPYVDSNCVMNEIYGEQIDESTIQITFKTSGKKML